VRTIAGDIERERLGIPENVYEGLCGNVASVMHCAAAVDWSQRYEALRGPNVSGICELLRFASRVRRKAFHFVSSISVCYSTRDCKMCRTPMRIRPPLQGFISVTHKASGLPKPSCAKREGADWRPQCIARAHRGHSTTGIANNDDLLARLIKGCIEMGAAPDLAWRIDACPVDFVATAIVRLSRSDAGPYPVHLVNPRSGRWPEAVLWMNLRGYRVRLLPFADWIALVDARSRDRLHPLHALRGFLLNRPSGEGGRYLAELYAEPHAASVGDAASRRLLDSLGLSCAPLGSSLLQTWFDGYTRSGFPAAGSSSQRVRKKTPNLKSQIESLLKVHGADSRLRVRSVRRFELGGDNSILGELACWHAGSMLELHGCSVKATAGGGTPRELEIVIKPKPADDAVSRVACEVSALCNPRLGAAFAAHWKHTPFAGTAAREIALYRCGDPRLLACAPAFYGRPGLRRSAGACARARGGHCAQRSVQCRTALALRVRGDSACDDRSSAFGVVRARARAACNRMARPRTG